MKLDSFFTRAPKRNISSISQIGSQESSLDNYDSGDSSESIIIETKPNQQQSKRIHLDIENSNEITTQHSKKLCKGYQVEKEVYKNFPFSIFEKNLLQIKFSFSDGDFRHHKCVQNNYLMFDENREVNLACEDLKYNQNLQKNLKKPTDDNFGLPYDYCSHNQLVHNLKRKTHQLNNTKLHQ